MDLEKFEKEFTELLKKYGFVFWMSGETKEGAEKEVSAGMIKEWKKLRLAIELSKLNAE